MALRLPRGALVPLLVLLLLLVHATDATPRLEMVTSAAPARGGAGAGTTSRARVAAASCASWRLGVETNNIRGWYSIPAACRGYVSDYMFGEQFRQDCAVVAREAAAYAEGLALAGDGREAWVFDVDDTALTNLPYYADTGFGAEPYNATYFEEYVANATAPALPEVLGLYGKLLALGIKVVFITGRHDYEREPTVKNLRSAGYHTWEKLVLKPSSLGSSVVPYKSGERQKLVDAGYRIVGNMGDQWSDLVGAPEGDRTFKVPDPMYYVA
ncbi:acid phosphatase 1-like isoform X2 [Panicum miliaceum]|uniref:Acid phosphatase 1-like isoform X2 n=1 Tax=Panicum miliaceum TaxID=4540 RepID=A0A3L6R8J7_PANMI|nr:acid phosphatase 1-like isoform X2 [Panicum miliaceum]